jgi:hypothetical protein
MSFRISGLPLADFAPLLGRPDAELAKHGAIRMTADRRPGFPCRVSLRDAEPGETVLLLNYEHLPVATPYRSRHAIFVRENAEEARVGIDEVPELLRIRLLSLRGFDEAGMLREAEVAEGARLTAAIESLFAHPEVAYLHLHNAKAGCFAARVDRA